MEYTEPTLYVNLIGRIGNNLFQLATAASLAFRNNCRMVAIPDSSYVLPEPDNCSLYQYLNQFRSSLLRKVDIRVKKPMEYILYEEPFYQYKAIPYRNGLFLQGYFQSEKYFDSSFVHDLFQIDTNTYNLLFRKYGFLFQNKEVTSINVRRGDYLSCPDFHPVCSLEYFQNAVEIIGTKTQFLITSDDIDWCKSHFVGDNFYFADRIDPVENLYLQTLCTNNIISNSSFSWWGAWLNPNPNKTVIAPKIWYGAKAYGMDTLDLLPISWIKI